jgi:hypothetical protein
VGRWAKLDAYEPFTHGGFNASDSGIHRRNACAGNRQRHAGIGSRHFPKERLFNG